MRLTIAQPLVPKTSMTRLSQINHIRETNATTFLADFTYLPGKEHKYLDKEPRKPYSNGPERQTGVSLPSISMRFP
jgi:hypothetical protein